jgi:uncharacterized protein (TIGR02145 family)
MKKSITFLLAMLCLAITSCSQKCGETAYDSKTQFCHDNSKIVDKCGGEVYNPDKQFCHSDGKIYSCSDQPYNPDAQFCHDNSIVVDKCSGEVFEPSNQFCDARDNKIYKYVKIGAQFWMAENLNFNVDGSRCYYNDPANCDKYGRSYDWAMAMALANSCNNSACSKQAQAKHKGICPDGWHLPTDKEWDVLVKTAGGSGTAGKHLKSKSGWLHDGKSGNGLDTYGFAALSEGRSWWTSSEINYTTDFGSTANSAYYRSIGYNHDYTDEVYNGVGKYYNFESAGDSYLNVKSFFFGIRCVKD